MANKRPGSPYSDEFAGWVKSALHQIYDSPFLQTHPLAHLLADPQMDTLQRTQNLRGMLLNAINSMRPEEGQATKSASWKVFQILELRYIEGLSPPEIMKKMALSRSHYFHEHSRLIDSLTSILWDQYQEKLRKSAGDEAPPAVEAPAGPSEGLRPGADLDLQLPEQDAENEFQRMVSKAVWENVELPALLDQLRPVLEPILRERQVKLEFHFPNPAVSIRADRILLRQVLLNTLSLALQAAAGRTVRVEGLRHRDETQVRIQFEETGLLPSEDQPAADARVEICRRIMTDLNGTFELSSPSPRRWEACLRWKTGLPRVLLVIDDNEALADLFSRYLAGHDWQVIGAPDGKIARELIAENRPYVILLDIMMPQEDGWEFLMSLKAREETASIPVIVCSVLPEEKLALSLGAEAYLSKPVSQRALLHTLARWNTPGSDPE